MKCPKRDDNSRTVRASRKGMRRAERGSDLVHEFTLNDERRTDKIVAPVESNIG